MAEIIMVIKSISLTNLLKLNLAFLFFFNLMFINFKQPLNF